jgi:phospholipid transport system substrate-binding protein
VRRFGRSVAILALLLAVCTSAGAADEPRAVVEATTTAALQVLRDQGLSADDKRRRIEDIVYARVDFETFTRLVLARGWSQLNATQQQEFIQEFKRHLSLTYGRNVESYRNEHVTITEDREEARGDWTVKTKILRTGGGADILVDYRLRKKDGSWRIIDIIIEGVSMVSNYRSQFQEIMASGGPERLLHLLREKNAKGEAFKAPLTTGSADNRTSSAR